MPARRSLRAVALVLAAAPMTLAAPAHATTSTNRLQQDLDAVVDVNATSVLAVVQDGDRQGAGSAGPRSVGSRASVDPYGRFRAGSVTKSFLATVVLQLVDERRVGLDTPIDRYVSGIPDGNRITVRMLLDHTSGLYDYTESLPLNPPSGFLGIRWKHWTPTELLARATSHPLLFEPGTGYAYADTDYLVLGMLVQHTTNQSPAEEIRHRIIEPLQLHDTDIPTGSNLTGPHAEAYLPMPDGSRADITRFDPSVLAYAGDIVSSARDLNRFFAALSQGRLLRSQTTRVMTMVEVPAKNYGLGVERLPLSCGGSAIGHDGDVPGYSTWAFTVPRDHRSVTVSMTWGTARPKAQVLQLVDDALCGRISAR